MEYKRVTVSNTWVRYRHTCSLFFDLVAIFIEAQTQSLSGKTMRSADVAIAWPPVERLHQFGSADLEGASANWGASEVRCCQIRTTGRMGKNLPVPSVHGVHCGASNVWPDIILQQQCSKLKKHLRGLRFQTDEDVQEEVRRWLRLQDASFYQKGYDSLIHRCDKCLNKYGDYVEKQTACVPVSDPCVTYCNLF
jgi:hypothetical protein